MKRIIEINERDEAGGLLAEIWSGQYTGPITPSEITHLVAVAIPKEETFDVFEVTTQAQEGEEHE